MSPLEFRILTSVFDAPAYLGYYYGEMLTLLGDELSKTVIGVRFVRAIARLFQEQYLIAQRLDRDGQPTDEFFTPTVDEIEAALRREINFTYQLTQRGSQVWECCAKPNWSHYIRNSWELDDAGEMSRHALTGMQKTLVRIGVLLDSPCIVPGTLQWRVLRPWPVTYWKELSIGYEVSYRINPKRSRIVLGDVGEPSLWPPEWMGI